jgi:hypothetical protein
LFIEEGPIVKSNLQEEKRGSTIGIKKLNGWSVTIMVNSFSARFRNIGCGDSRL